MADPIFEDPLIKVTDVVSYLTSFNSRNFNVLSKIEILSSVFEVSKFLFISREAVKELNEINVSGYPKLFPNAIFNLDKVDSSILLVDEWVYILNLSLKLTVVPIFTSSALIYKLP